MPKDAKCDTFEHDGIGRGSFIFTAGQDAPIDWTLLFQEQTSSAFDLPRTESVGQVNLLERNVSFVLIGIRIYFGTDHELFLDAILASRTQFRPNFRPSDVTR